MAPVQMVIGGELDVGVEALAPGCCERAGGGGCCELADDGA